MDQSDRFDRRHLDRLWHLSDHSDPMARWGQRDLMDRRDHLDQCPPDHLWHLSDHWGRWDPQDHSGRWDPQDHSVH